MKHRNAMEAPSAAESIAAAELDNEEETPSSIFEVQDSNARLRETLARLVSASKNLDARVWLDGIYTELGDERVLGVLGKWMENREVYFKIEGKVGPTVVEASSRSSGDGP